jgi:hypothetical protein
LRCAQFGSHLKKSIAPAAGWRINRFNLPIVGEGKQKREKDNNMKQKISSLVTTFKNVDTFGIKYATDFPPASLGGQQFALVHAAVPLTAGLGATQVSGAEQTHSAVLAKVAGRFHLHDDMVGITNAAHSLALLGTAGIAGKFLMPHNNGDQALLNAARAFAADAVAFQAQFVSVGLPATFITQLNSDIAGFETAVSTKGAALGTKAGATSGLEDAAHKAAVALHVLNTVVKNTCKNNPARLAEWTTASHVEKHTPVPRAKPSAAPAQK